MLIYFLVQFMKNALVCVAQSYPDRARGQGSLWAGIVKINLFKENINMMLPGFEAGYSDPLDFLRCHGNHSVNLSSLLNGALISIQFRLSAGQEA